MKKGTKKEKEVKIVEQPKAVVSGPKPCGCGCEAMTKGGRFLPGHDARFHAAQKKAAPAKGGKVAVKKSVPKEKSPQKEQPAANVVAQPKAKLNTEHYGNPEMEADRVLGYNDGVRGRTDSRAAKNLSAYTSGNEDGLDVFLKVKK